MAGSRVYNTINGRPLHDYIAHLPGVKNAVAEEAGRVGALAKAIASSANLPKGVRVLQGKRDGITDSYVYLVGPSDLAPGASLAMVAAVEFGRSPFISTKTIFMPPDAKYPKGRFVPPGTHIAGFPGKHILRRTWELA